MIIRFWIKLDKKVQFENFTLHIFHFSNILMVKHSIYKNNSLSDQ